MKEDVNSARVIGVMSGSSLDGIDLALCHFAKDGKQWSFTIKKAGDGAMHEQLLHAGDERFGIGVAPDIGVLSRCGTMRGPTPTSSHRTATIATSRAKASRYR
jgi:hypothetical protein